MFGLGLTLTQAAPVALIAVGIASAVGALQGLMRGLVRYKAALLMAAVGALTAPVGLSLARRLPAHWLSLTFAAVMLLVAARMVQQSRRQARPRARPTPRPRPAASRPRPAASSGTA